MRNTLDDIKTTSPKSIKKKKLISRRGNTIKSSENGSNSSGSSIGSLIVENYERERELTGGKSGSAVNIIKDENGRFIIEKIFSDVNMRDEEHMKSKNIYDVFKKYYKTNNPIVKTYNAIDRLSLSNSKNPIEEYCFFMEFLDSNLYTSLDRVIKDLCLGQTDTKYKKLNMLDLNKIFKNIFKFLSIMKLEFFSHCDFHTENVFVNRKNLNVKIIDFGLAKTDCEPCKSTRDYTAAIIKTRNSCKKDLISLSSISKILSKKNIDSDISMFISIISIFYDDPNIIPILQDISSRIYNSTISESSLSFKRTVIFKELAEFESLLDELFKTKDSRIISGKKTKISVYK